MSYDVVVWEGERPLDDEAAGEVFEELAGEHLEGEMPSPLTPRIDGFVDAVLRRWPDLTEDDELSPFASGPLKQDGSGPVVHIALSYSRADEVSPEIARLAAELGLVCFDPQLGCLLPHAGRCGGPG